MRRPIDLLVRISVMSVSGNNLAQAMGQSSIFKSAVLDSQSIARVGGFCVDRQVAGGMSVASKELGPKAFGLSARAGSFDCARLLLLGIQSSMAMIRCVE